MTRKRLTVGDVLDLLTADRDAWTPERTAMFGEWRHQCVYVEATYQKNGHDYSALHPAYGPALFDTLGLIIDGRMRDDV